MMSVWYGHIDIARLVTLVLNRDDISVKAVTRVTCGGYLELPRVCTGHGKFTFPFNPRTSVDLNHLRTAKGKGADTWPPEISKTYQCSEKRCTALVR